MAWLEWVRKLSGVEVNSATPAQPSIEVDAAVSTAPEVPSPTEPEAVAPPELHPTHVFLTPDALSINRARLDHLASLNLDLNGKRVLEVGAGIGLHTGFFEERGCEIISTEGLPSNVVEMLRLHPNRTIGVVDLDKPIPLTDLGMFDIVYCYGTLYHLNDPEGAIARMAEVCRGQILMETVVSRGSALEINLLQEHPTANQAVRGVGCRPTRPWVLDALKRHMGYAYTTWTQPDYVDFVTDWEIPYYAMNMRSIFVGSKVPLENPALTDKLPMRHHGAVPTGVQSSSGRVWVDVGAYEGAESLAEAQASPDLIVHAFEPDPRRFDTLMKLPSNFRIHAQAVGERNGISKFHLNAFNAASSLLPMIEDSRREWIGGDQLVEEKTIFVPTIRLDTFMADQGISEIEYLKIDTQGADLQVVRSAGDRLRDIRRIKLEVQTTEKPLYEGSATKAEIVSYLEERGFEVVAEEFQSYDQEQNLTFQRRS